MLVLDQAECTSAAKWRIRAFSLLNKLDKFEKVDAIYLQAQDFGDFRCYDGAGPTIREGGKLQEKRNYKLVSKWLWTSPCSGWTEGGEDELSTG